MVQELHGILMALSNFNINFNIFLLSYFILFKFERKQIDLYTELIKDYDRKHKELIIENTDLKTFIADLLSNLNHSLKNNSNEVDASFNQSAGNASRLNLDDNCEGTDVDRALCDEIVRLPFDNTFKKVNSEFEKKLELIKNRIQVILNSLKLVS